MKARRSPAPRMPRVLKSSAIFLMVRMRASSTRSLASLLASLAPNQSDTIVSMFSKKPQPVELEEGGTPTNLRHQYWSIKVTLVVTILGGPAQIAHGDVLRKVVGYEDSSFAINAVEASDFFGLQRFDHVNVKWLSVERYERLSLRDALSRSLL